MSVHRITHRIVIGFAAAAFLGCAGGDDAGSAGGAAATPDAAATTVTDPGTIVGMVHLNGEPPANPSIDMATEPTCAQKHSTPPVQEAVVVNGGMLANAFVYIKEGLSGTFPPPAEAVTIDQNGCIYHPRVAGVQVGQDIAFQNSDGLLHNVKTTPQNNQLFNISQPRNMTTSRKFTAAEVMVPVQCDVHGWMFAYVGVLDHPYFAVSGADGSFRIENVPPGTYTIEVWHERFGTMTQQVTVAPNATAEAMLTYDAAAQANATVPLGSPIDPHDHGHAGPAVPGTH